MTSFLDIVDVNTDEIEEAPVLPVGTYILEVTKPTDVKQSNSGEWDMINYPCRVVEAYEVDEDDLEDFGNVEGEPAMITFMAPRAEGTEAERNRQRTLNQVKKFHEDVLNQGGGNLKQLMAECKGHRFLAAATHEEYNDATQVRWGKPMPLDED